MMKKTVAFVCVHNSCRSQMAEAWAKKLGAEVLEAYSAGTESCPEVNPLAVEVMEEAGVSMSGYRPKLLNELPAKHRYSNNYGVQCGVSAPALW